MDNDKNYKRLMILTIILLILVLGMSVYILINAGVINLNSSNNSQNQISTDESAKLQEMFDKTVFGKIIDINEKMITVEMTEPPTDANSQPKIVQKEIKINSNTKFKKYEAVGNAQGSYQAVNANLSDFKKDDYISIEVDKKSSETDLTAASIDLVTLPTTK